MCFSWLQLLAHIVRRMAFNPQLTDHAARIQLGVASTTPSENKLTLPRVQTKSKDHTKSFNRLTGLRSAASWDMMVNTRLLLLSAISRREEVDDSFTLTHGLRNRNGWCMTRISLTLDFNSQPSSAWNSRKLSNASNNFLNVTDRLHVNFRTY